MAGGLQMHSLVAGAIGTVNPFVKATLRRSTGYVTNADFTRTPTYEDTQLLIQVQALASEEIRQVEGLNLQGNKTAVYLSGRWNGLVRAGKQGGDMLKFHGKVWLVAIVLEDWASWTKLAVVEQNGA